MGAIHFENIIYQENNALQKYSLYYFTFAVHSSQLQTEPTNIVPIEGGIGGVVVAIVLVVILVIFIR
jgi:hypothetical protein